MDDEMGHGGGALLLNEAREKERERRNVDELN
jgi:hypothetical protein